MSKFVGRDAELKQLIDISNKKTASFVVVRGRRRIGKSRLIEEYAKNFDKFYTFIGLAPDKNVTIKHQVDEFSRQISQQFQTSFARYDDWSDALWAVGERVQKGKILVLFDEISWMGSEDPTFLAKIKNFWDQFLKKNDQLVFIVCGSASAWIEKNIMSSKGFVGRITKTMTIEELSLSECSKFWPKNVSSYEKLKVLSVMGGIPRYLEEIDPHISAEENIKRLCFEKGGILVGEFDQIFSDLFLRDSQFYRKIVESLILGAKERDEIAKEIKIDPSGRLTEFLRELELAGFITCDYTWKISSGMDSKLRKYRLSDNYLRFYLKYIHQNKTKINRNSFHLTTMSSMIGWDTIMGFQFENLVLNNRHLIHQYLNINPNEIVCENPYYQRQTKRFSGCQIDYMIQTKFDSLYVCEIKFSKHEIGVSVIPEVQKKINSLHRPRGTSCRPVLIHVNGVSEQLIEEDYFSAIIDVSSFLQN